MSGDTLSHGLDAIRLVILLDFFDRAADTIGHLVVGILPALCRLGDLMHEVARLHGDSTAGFTRLLSVFALGPRQLLPTDDSAPRGSPPSAFVICLIRASAAAAATPPPPARGCLVVLGGLGVSCAVLFLGLFFEQGLTVGDRDLIVVGVNFSEGEEAVAVAAVINEGSLKRRLNARHLGEIDIASELLLVR